VAYRDPVHDKCEHHGYHDQAKTQIEFAADAFVHLHVFQNLYAPPCLKAQLVFFSNPQAPAKPVAEFQANLAVAQVRPRAQLTPREMRIMKSTVRAMDGEG
jgi:hypothetical protein